MQGARCKVRGSRFKVQGAKYKFKVMVILLDREKEFVIMLLFNDLRRRPKNSQLVPCILHPASCTSHLAPKKNDPKSFFYISTFFASSLLSMNLSNTALITAIIGTPKNIPITPNIPPPIIMATIIQNGDKPTLSPKILGPR